MAKPTYRWKRTGWGVDANLAGDALEQLRRQSNDILTAPMVVDAASSPAHVLHRCFEWDNEVAGPKYREIQAGEIMRSLVVVIAKQGDQERTFRAFVNVERDGESGYTALSVAMSDTRMREQLIRDAWRELSAWRQKYADLTEFAAVYRAIEQTERKLG